MEGQAFALDHQKAFHDIPGPPHGAREEVLGEILKNKKRSSYININKKVLHKTKRET